MVLLASKILPPLLFPIGLAILLCLGAAWLAFRKGAVAAGLLALLASALLYAGASPLVSNRLMQGLERRYPPPDAYHRSSAIVLLGGGMTTLQPPRREVETSTAGDRVLHAARLWRRGVAPVVVPTGGYIPFLTDAPGTEADLYAALLSELLGVPDSAIVRVRGSRTTHEDALLTAALFDSLGIGKDILLVTSSSHMSRAAALFHKAGFTVQPAPTDFHSTENGAFRMVHLLPSASALAMTYIALTEYLGLFAYWLLGRL